MTGEWSSALWQAAGRGDHATVLRLARGQLDWTQGDLGARFGCSASAVSRYESGRRLLRDVSVLRRFAGILGLPPEAFGLTATRPASSDRRPAPAPRVARTGIRSGDEDMRRRSFLVAAGLAGTAVAGSTSAVAVPVDPATVLADRLGAALLNQESVLPSEVGTLTSGLARARADFRACRYVPLAQRLPRLLAAAQATAVASGTSTAHAALAEAYNTTTRALIKLDVSGLEWISADRAVHAADRSSDPLVYAESLRMMAAVCRRAGHHGHAHELLLRATDQLEPHRADHAACHGLLMLTAAYTAAKAGDRDQADGLLAEAATTVHRLRDQNHGLHRELSTNLVSHRVSIAYSLGDSGTALAHARTLAPEAIPNAERRGRFLADVALAYAQWDKPDHALRALLAAEHQAPEEIRTRASVRRLITDLLGRRPTLPDLRALAIRTHVA